MGNVDNKFLLANYSLIKLSAKQVTALSESTDLVIVYDKPAAAYKNTKFSVSIILLGLRYI